MNKNPSQKRAVAHLSGPMMVLAGPGSGKTSVIVERTAYMIREGKIPASSILVVTFSRAAAREMRDRFLKFMETDKTPVTFGTFHGVFYAILKQAYHLSSGNILSEEEKYGMLHELILCHGGELAEEGDLTEEIAKEISVVKGGRISLEYYHSVSCPDEVFQNIYRDYCRICRKKRKLDFDDMLLYCYDLFLAREDILKKWQNKFQYILVDEFQDINRLQYEIVLLLAKPQNNLFIVGDDDQSIYHFRGARPEIMLNFKKDFPQAETVLLNINYRCSKNILKTAMNVINCNKKRFKKSLSTPNEEGLPVCCMEYDNPGEEYAEVAKALKKRYCTGEKLENTALLLRTNQEAEGLIRILMGYGIPFVMKEQLPNLFKHWICRNILAYFSLAQGDKRRKNFLEIMNKPNRYISREAVANTVVSFRELKEYYHEKEWMCDRITTLETHLKILSTLPPYAGINFIRKGMGYEEYLCEYARYRKLKPEELTEVLDRLMESAKGMKSLEEWTDYIQDYTEKLTEQAKKQEIKSEGVVISTLHGVKGLEYDHVYILNVNEGSIPYKKAILEEAVEEERRLFYVGMTRAKQELTLCFVKRQYEKEREPSRFLEEAGV